MISLTKSLAKSFGKNGIRVNTINPGPLDSNMTKEWPKNIKSNLKDNSQ